MAAPEECYRHRRLSLSFSIRLLELEPGLDQEAEIHINLNEAQLNSGLQYEALSYVWGDHGATQRILCNGKIFLVTPNCKSALRHLRLREKTRTLWIDAICIDQTYLTDLTERNQQVGIMGEIYSHASKVVIWLGESTQDSDLAITLLSKFELILNAGNSERDIFVKKHWEELRDMDRARKSLGSSQESVLRGLYVRPWFDRVWTVQEAGLARSALIICGTATIPWQTFVFAVQRLARYGAQRTGQEGAEGRLYRLIDLHRSVCEKLGRIPTRRSQPRPDLGSLFTSIYSKSCREPIDKVFALYGVLQALKIDMPAPDYSKTAAQVFSEAARKIIEVDKDLSILTTPRNAEDQPEIPSWVPACPKNPDLLAPSSIRHNCFSASTYDSKGICTSSEGGQRLEVLGRIFDTIERRSESCFMPHAIPDGLDPRIFYVQHIEQLVKMFQEWIRLACRAKLYPEYPGGDHTVYALFNTLVQDGSGAAMNDAFMAMPRLQKACPAWYALIVAPFPRIGDGMEMVEKMLDAQLETYPRIPSWLPPDMHSVLETDEWKIMKAIEQDPETAFFASQAHSHGRSKAFFTTREGYVGTAGTIIEAGDRLALVSGVQVPLVVRKDERGDNFYRLISPAFVHGVMFGEKWPEDEGELENIVLV